MPQCLQHFHDQLHAEAVRLAGGLTDLAQRATVYRHLFRASDGNHVFPLIAAHGALWAGGHFRFGRRLAGLLSCQYAWKPRRRAAQLRKLAEFQDTLRDVNRRVCIDTYVNFHLTARFGIGDDVRALLPEPLADALDRVHFARRQGRQLSDREKRHVFEAHFLHEQQHVVGPAVADAVERLDWPAVRWFALRPPIRFKYFPRRQSLRFRNFADRHERIAHGLTAFQLATQAGWSRVEATLNDYGVLPKAFFVQPEQHFAAMRSAILAAG